jgi:hypothetical protein
VPGQVENLIRVPQGRHSFVTASSARRPRCLFLCFEPASEAAEGFRIVVELAFRPASKPFVFVIPSGLWSARDLLFRLFQQPLQPATQIP